jgi:hypothetical protein
LIGFDIVVGMVCIHDYAARREGDLTTYNYALTTDDMGALFHARTVTNFQPWGHLSGRIQNFKSGAISDAAPGANKDESRVSQDQRMANTRSASDGPEERTVNEPGREAPIEVCDSVAEPENVYNRPPSRIKSLYLL